MIVYSPKKKEVFVNAGYDVSSYILFPPISGAKSKLTESSTQGDASTKMRCLG